MHTTGTFETVPGTLEEEVEGLVEELVSCIEGGRHAREDRKCGSGRQGMKGIVGSLTKKYRTGHTEEGISVVQKTGQRQAPRAIVSAML